MKETNNEVQAESAAQQIQTPNTDAEKKAVECFAALEVAERNFTEGLEFGRAVIEIRTEIKSSGGKNWMQRLEELGITYAKARYWIAVVEGKPAQRSKTKAQEPALDWDTALAKLKPLVDEIEIIKRRKPVGSTILEGELIKLAEILGYELVKSGGHCA